MGSCNRGSKSLTAIVCLEELPFVIQCLTHGSGCLKTNGVRTTERCDRCYISVCVERWYIPLYDMQFLANIYWKYYLRFFLIIKSPFSRYSFFIDPPLINACRKSYLCWSNYSSFWASVEFLCPQNNYRIKCSFCDTSILLWIVVWLWNDSPISIRHWIGF